eukprot:scaffold6045_cov77-Skeletonema_marinoi.AAC.8
MKKITFSKITCKRHYSEQSSNGKSDVKTQDVGIEVEDIILQVLTIGARFQSPYHQHLQSRHLLIPVLNRSHIYLEEGTDITKVAASF